MQKTIWFGAKDDKVQFADNQQALTTNGIANAKSFTVDGEVTGLNLLGQNEQQVGAQSSASQPTA